MQLSRPLLTSVTLFAALQVMACGPTLFEDASALQIVGDPPRLPAPPPPPPPEPEPEPEPPKRVVVEDNRIVINEKIQFDVNKATIRPESDSLLQEIIKVIKENAHIKKIAIEGHTSSEGSDRSNLKLSDNRAKSVMDYLVTKGSMPKEMFTAKGFGETKLIDDESSGEDGREKNRRVEFNIIEQDVTQKKVEIDPKSGEKKVLEEKTATEAKAAEDAAAAEAAKAGDAKAAGGDAKAAPGAKK